MREALIIAAQYLRRLVRRPALVLLLVAVPVTLAVIEYGAFGSGVASGKLPPIKVLFLDEDASFASRFVPQFFSGGAARDIFVTENVADREGAKRAFRRSEAAALIVVPRGFQDAILAGRHAEIVLYKNPIETIGPDIVEGVLGMLEAVGNRLYAEAIAPLDRIRALQRAGRDPTSDDIAEIARGFYDAGFRLNRLSMLERNSVVVQRPNAAPETQFGFKDRASFFATFFPGLAVFALFFLAQSLAIGLLRDRIRGVERRILTTPASRSAIAAGGAAYVVTAVFASLLVQAAIGVVAFGITLRHPLTLTLIGAGFAAFASGLHLLVVSVARSDRGAGFVSTAVMLILLMLGGTFMPADSFPAWLRVVSFRVPNGAAQQAFIEVLARGRTIAGVGSLLAVIWLWAILMLAAYVYFSRRAVVR